MKTAEAKNGAAANAAAAARGFVMFNRAPEVAELFKDPLAFTLAAQIAQRARWRTNFSSDGVELGEALIGDYKSVGMTRSQYRTRVERLEKWQIIATRTTNKGTIAKLISSLVFDINAGDIAQENNQQNHQQIANGSPSNRQQIANGSPLTNNERTSKEKRNKENDYSTLAIKDRRPDSSGRPDAPRLFDRDDIPGSLERMLGSAEWKKNARMWNKRWREHPAALAAALEDLATQARTTVFRTNKAAWLTARFEKVLLEREKAAARAQIKTSQSKPVNVEVPDIVPEESGYMLEGRFLTTAQAEQFVIDNPDKAEFFTTKARRAVRWGSEIRAV